MFGFGSPFSESGFVAEHTWRTQDGLTYRINEQALPWRGQAEVKDSEYRDCGIMASSKEGNRTRVRDHWWESKEPVVRPWGFSTIEWNFWRSLHSKFYGNSIVPNNLPEFTVYVSTVCEFVFFFLRVRGSAQNVDGKQVRRSAELWWSERLRSSWIDKETGEP